MTAEAAIAVHIAGISEMKTPRLAGGICRDDSVGWRGAVSFRTAVSYVPT